MVKTAGIYCRISQDARGDQLGVGRQRDDCLALVEKKGWAVHDIYVDNDMSAFSGKARPEYRRLLEDVQAGTVDTVVVWHPDRLHRSPRELEDFIEVIEAARASVATCTAGDYDLGTPEGRLTARIVGSVARKESEDKSRRLRRKMVELANNGKLSGGGRRPFAYDNDRVTIREGEAALVREAAQRVLSGESVRSVVNDWVERGVPTVTGARWSSTTLKRLLRSGRISGQREHQGQIVSDAVWPAIISKEDTFRLRAILDDEARDRRRREPRRYLLTGFVRCGRCSERPMTTRPTARGKGRYVCTVDRGGCGRCGISADGLEVLVTEGVLIALDSPQMAEALRVRDNGTDVEEATRRLAHAETALEELAHDFYVERVISRGEFLAARQGLEARADVARTEIAGATKRSGITTKIAAEPLREAWPTMNLSQRRSVIGEVLDRVVVAPTTRANNKFDPERVQFVWPV